MKSENKIFKSNLVHQELLELLEQQFSLHAVYLLSTFTHKDKQQVLIPPIDKQAKTLHSFTLFIISYKPVSGNLGLIMDDLYNKMHQQCRVYLITMTISEVVKQLNFGSNFLLNVLNKTTCIYRENDSLDKYMHIRLCYHPSSYKLIKRVWEHRMKRADCWISMVYVDNSRDDEFVDFGMLHYGLEQICVALIYIHWEYIPSYYSLSYLMHLCSHFTDLPKQFFLKDSYRSKRIFYMLNNGQHDMRFKAFQEYSKKDSEKAYRLCEQFFNEAKVIGKQHLKTIKPIHFSNP